jgi:hypothetical protein
MRRYAAVLRHALLAVLFLLAAVCCKNHLSADASMQLMFSADTLGFDTVFTAAGSATRRLMVYNTGKQTVRTRIVLPVAGASPFRFNVDGAAASGTCEAEIAGQDSLYIFVEVTVDPQNSDLPALVSDSVVFFTGDHRQRVRLEAYGQDVFVLRDTLIRSDTWQGDKPYLIRGRLTVDTLHVLTVGQGVHVYLDRGADIYVKGTLRAEGTVEKPAVFSGSRTEEAYRDVPAQWGSIILATASRNNVLRHVEIRNGVNGILAGSPAGGHVPHILLEAVSIRQMSHAGVMTFAADLDARNCLISNCGYYAAGLFCGGTARFAHCTVANSYSPYIRRRNIPAVTVNTLWQGYGAQTPAVAEWNNSIVYGTLGEELSMGEGVNYVFRHCLLRTRSDVSSPAFLHVLAGVDPLFAAPEKGNFRLGKNSPARNAGDPALATEAPEDMDGNDRSADPAPDMGAFNSTDDR